MKRLKNKALLAVVLATLAEAAQLRPVPNPAKLTQHRVW